MNVRRTPFRFAVGLVFLAIALGAGKAGAQSAGAPIPFVSHATFFSQMTKRSDTIDPQVFVQDGKTPAGTGPQGIANAVGYRNARPDDPASAKLYTSEGLPLVLTLDRWFGAHGDATISTAPNGFDRVVVHFDGLIAFGVYSLFEATFLPDGSTEFRPLDGDGDRNTFTAGQDGSASEVVNVGQHLTSANAIVLVYHSDGKNHGSSRGTLGVDAHEQLIARIPQS